MVLRFSELNFGYKNSRGNFTRASVIVEVSEMTGARHADLENLKTFISQQDDGTVRFAYRRDPETMLRRCILAGTSNNEFMLPNDPTGLRRFVPIKLNDPKHETEAYIAGHTRATMGGSADSAIAKASERDCLSSCVQEASKVAARHRSTDEIVEDKVKALPETLRTGASLQEITEHMGYEGLVSRKRIYEGVYRASEFRLDEAEGESEGETGECVVANMIRLDLVHLVHLVHLFYMITLCFLITTTTITTQTVYIGKGVLGGLAAR